MTSKLYINKHAELFEIAIDNTFKKGLASQLSDLSESSRNKVLKTDRYGIYKLNANGRRVLEIDTEFDIDDRFMWDRYKATPVTVDL